MSFLLLKKGIKKVSLDLCYDSLELDPELLEIDLQPMSISDMKYVEDLFVPGFMLT